MAIIKDTGGKQMTYTSKEPSSSSSSSSSGGGGGSSTSSSPSTSMNSNSKTDTTNKDISKNKKISKKPTIADAILTMDFDILNNSSFLLHPIPDTNQNNQNNKEKNKSKEKNKFSSSQLKPRLMDEDKKTPDHWIERSPVLIRNTGIHPLNAEPPVEALLRNWITPNALHYVRNHGKVPELKWNDHKISIEG